MSSIKKLYHQYIYGLMGTLIFHILLFSVFILAEVDFKGKVREEAIVLDFSTMKEMEELMSQVEKAKDQNTPSSQYERSAAISNRAVNDARMKDDFFDKEYLKDVQAAQKMVNDVNSQLSKEISDVGDFNMPELTTEGVDPDSIKNIIYSGKSNIHYYLENRYHVSLRNPVYLARGGGKVIVDIVVDRNGRVSQAKCRNSVGTNDPMLSEYAQSAALRTVFNADQSAPKSQNGTITYTFVSQ